MHNLSYYKTLFFTLSLSINASFAAGNGSVSGNTQANQLSNLNSVAAQQIRNGFVPNYGSKTIMTTGQWRKKITHPSQNGQYFIYSSENESSIGTNYQYTLDSVNQSQTVFTEFFPAIAANQSADVITYTQGYQTGTFTEYVVTGLGKSGILKGAFTLPASGHMGKTLAKDWSKTDTINIYRQYTDKNGQSQNELIASAKSLDFMTVMETEIPLIANKEVAIFIERVGSNGHIASPWGFIESRKLLFTWDGK